MVVDDDPLVLKVLARELQVEFDIVTANSFDAALSLLDAEEEIAAVVSDFHLGVGQSGVDLLAEVQRNRPTCTRVLVSGAATPRDVAEGIARGVIDHFFHKPFTPGSIRSLLHSLLEPSG